MPSPETEAPPAPAPAPRWVSRLRRTSLRVRIAAGIVAAGLAAAVVIVTVPSSSPPPQYTGLPAPCTMVSRASLAGLMPHPVGTPLGVPTDRDFKAGSCRWSSAAGGQDRTLHATVVVFKSPSATQDARQIYDESLAASSCHCRGVAISRRSVAGLGDQATALSGTAGPGADEVTASGGAAAGEQLYVVSRNAEITLSFEVTTAATETILPPGATQLTDMISVARDILAQLARPTAVRAAPVSPEPDYAGRRDPCRLMTGATVAKYAPGGTVAPDTAPAAAQSALGAQTTACSWGSNSALIVLDFNVFPDAADALQGFVADAEGHSLSVPGTTVTGSTWLFDVGEQAAVFYQTRSPGHGVEILVQSGNIELDYWYNDTARPAPSIGTLLAAAAAMARDGLAALASPKASSYQQGPVYASPGDTCSLIKASTLARYASGATVDSRPAALSSPEQLSSCGWSTAPGSLTLNLTIYTSADGALGGYEFDIENTRQNPVGGSTFDSERPVKGLGDRATAIVETSLGEPEVDLSVVSGNAEIELDFSDLPFSPVLSRDALLAADIAMARDVLADLPR